MEASGLRTRSRERQSGTGKASWEKGSCAVVALSGGGEGRESGNFVVDGLLTQCVAAYHWSVICIQASHSAASHLPERGNGFQNERVLSRSPPIVLGLSLFPVLAHIVLFFCSGRRSHSVMGTTGSPAAMARRRRALAKYVHCILPLPMDSFARTKWVSRQHRGRYNAEQDGDTAGVDGGSPVLHC